jgi:hypothetical protein
MNPALLIPLIPYAIEAGKGLLASGASKRAASTQSGSIDRAMQTLGASYEKGRQNLLPYLESGRVNLDELNKALRGGDFTPVVNMEDDPGVKYRMERANEALQKSSAARGRLLSGGTIRNIAELNQALASQEYGAAYERSARDKDREFTRLFSMTEQGRGSADTLARLTAQEGISMADLLTSQGGVQAAGDIGSSNALSGILGPLGQMATSFLGSKFGASGKPTNLSAEQLFVPPVPNAPAFGSR